MKLGLLLAGLGVLAAPRYAAADDLPVVVEYVAPKECASAEAFHALLAT